MIRREAPGARSGPKSDLRRNVGIAYGGVAVVKVPPPIGCVKYKAQDVVLSMRIPLLMHGKCVKGPKNAGVWLWKSRFRRVFGGDYEMVNRCEFEGMRGGGKAQGAGVVQWVWIRGGWRWKSGWIRVVVGPGLVQVVPQICPQRFRHIRRK
jgi:hypothetical protein